MTVRTTTSFATTDDVIKSIMYAMKDCILLGSGVCICEDKNSKGIFEIKVSRVGDYIEVETHVYEDDVYFSTKTKYMSIEKIVQTIYSFL